VPKQPVSAPRDRRVGCPPRPPVPRGCLGIERHRDRWVAVVPCEDDPERVVFVPLDDLTRTG